jgi:hypothetical protein
VVRLVTSEQARGLVVLVRDGVEAGSTRVEEIQRASIANVVALVAVVPPLEAPAALVGSLVGSSVTLTHRAVRLASRGLAVLADRVLAAKHLG